MKYNGCNSHIKPICYDNLKQKSLHIMFVFLLIISISIYDKALSLKLSLHKFDFRNMKNIFKININLLYQLQKKRHLIQKSYNFCMKEIF